MQLYNKNCIQIQLEIGINNMSLHTKKPLDISTPIFPSNKSGENVRICFRSAETNQLIWLDVTCVCSNVL